MAKNYTKILVGLEAESSKLVRELEKANKNTKKWQSKTQKSVNTVKKAFIGLAGAYGVVALKNFAVRQIEVADNIGKTADKLGITTNALQEYRFAAEQTGVQMNVLDMGMQRFIRRAGEAQNGQGELKQTLEQLGIALQDANGTARSSEAILRDYADAIANAGSEQEQLRLAFKGFDSEGAALVNLFKKGSGAVEEYAKQARELGLVIDEGMIRKAEVARDKLNILTRALSAQAVNSVVQYADEIQNLVDSLLKFSKIVVQVPAFIQYLTESFAAAIHGSADLVRTNDELTKVLKRYEELANAVSGGDERGGMLRGMWVNSRFLNAELEKTGAKLDELVAKKELFTPPPQAIKQDEATQEEQKPIVAYDPPTEQLNELDNFLRERLIKIEESQFTETEKLNEVYGNREQLLDASLERNLLTQEKYDRLSLKLTKQKVKAEEKIERNKIRVVAGLMGALSQLAANSGKEQFELSKKLAIAETLMNTYAGAQAAFAETKGDIYVKAAAAAAALVMGFSRLQAIQSATYGGGSTAVGGGSAASLSELSPGVDEIDPQGPTNINVTIEGGVADRDTAEEIANALRQYMLDGGRAIA